MSKYNNKNHNYENNKFNEKKNFKQPKVNPNEIKVPLLLDEFDENVANEILKVLKETKFNKISIPVGTYRALLDDSLEVDDPRISTIGYIRNYNAEEGEFTVVLFGKFNDVIKSFDEIGMELNITNYKDHLGTITKFNIVPVEIIEEEELEEISE